MQSRRSLSWSVLRAFPSIVLAAVSFLVVTVAAAVMGFSASYSTMVWSAAVILAIGALPLLKWRTLVTLSLYAGLVISVGLFWLPPTSRGRFLDDLYSTKGMAIAQVRQKMKQYKYCGEGRTDASSWPGNRGGADSYIAYRHSEASAYNADVGAIAFKHGRAVYTALSPD